MQNVDKLGRNFSFFHLFPFPLVLVFFAAVGARMGQLCGRCMQLLRDFVALVQKMSSELVHSIKVLSSDKRVLLLETEWLKNQAAVQARPAAS